MENEIKPVQSSLPLGKYMWAYVPNIGDGVTFWVDAGHNLLDALYEQKKVEVEFFKTVWVDSATSMVVDTLTNETVGYLHRGRYEN